MLGTTLCHAVLSERPEEAGGPCRTAGQAGGTSQPSVPTVGRSRLGPWLGSGLWPLLTCELLCAGWHMMSLFTGGQ